MAHRPLLVIHSGTFHLDDAFAVLRLGRVLRGPGRDDTLARTRDTAVIAEADLVRDVGAVYAPAAGRFDHHQHGAPVREDGLPYSAAGLVWRHHGAASAVALASCTSPPSHRSLRMAAFGGLTHSHELPGRSRSWIGVPAGLGTGRRHVPGVSRPCGPFPGAIPSGSRHQTIGCLMLYTQDQSE